MTDFFVDDRLRPSRTVNSPYPANTMPGALARGAMPQFAPGGPKGGGAAARPNEPAPPTTGTPPPPTAPTTPATGAAPQYNLTNPPPAGSNVWGQYAGVTAGSNAGSYTSGDGSSTTDPNWLNNQNLPDWLKQQFVWNPGDQSIGGGTPAHWELQYTNGTGLKDANGNTVYQVGSMMNDPGKYFKDPSKIYYDPAIGWVTQDHNAVDWSALDQSSWHRDDYITAAITIGGGYLGANALAGTGPFASAASGDGIPDTAGLPGGGDPGAGPAPIGQGPYDPNLPAYTPDPATTADNLTPTINNAITPTQTPAPVSQGSTPLPGTAPETQPGAPVIDHSVTAPSGGTSLGSSIMNQIETHPLQAAGLGLSAATALGNKPKLPANAGNVNQNTDPNSPANQNANAMIASNGKPTADQAAAIDATIEEEWNRGREQIIQASVNAGQGGADSMVVQDKLRAFRTQLDTQKMQMYQSQADSNMRNALAELGMVNSAQFQLASLQLEQDQLAQQRTMQIMESLGWLFSFGGF